MKLGKFLQPMENRLAVAKSFLAAACFILAAAALGSIKPAAANCDPLGWFPTAFGVKDHTVFEYAGQTYIAAIYLPGEQQFAYARSSDYCNWEVLSPILTERTDGDWDENRIWAPFVIEEDGSYYMFYTGVNDEFAQSIMLATSTAPSVPDSWQEQGMVFQPSHNGAVWSATAWSDNRDPMVLKQGATYYLYYTGRDLTGGIVGLATASSLTGPWTDQGASLGPFSQRTPESPNVVSAWGAYYLFYHDTWLGQGYGELVRSGPSPSGPWGSPSPLFPGWAHEIWKDSGGSWYASYLTAYSITIASLDWDSAYSPPRPYIGNPLQYLYLSFTAMLP